MDTLSKKLGILLKFYLSLVLVILFSFGCSTRPPALPAEHAQKLPWGAIDLDVKSTHEYNIVNSLGTSLLQKIDQVKFTDNNSTISYNILALSGGGSRGSYGIGLIVGWEKKGDMPKFDVVTGISTGAVMAPFVFVGGEEVEKAKYFYTETKTESVFIDSILSFFSGYIMNPKPLQKLFRQNFDKAFLDKVAAEHAKGRRLYIGTTNIDTGQLIVWDMGAIASSDREDKYKRFSDIIYASTALPVYLPPQYIEVDIEGEKYYQMHVDGGIYSHVFMIGLLVDWEKVLNLKKDVSERFDTTMYVIANRKYRQRDIYTPVKQDSFDIIEAYVLIEMDLLFDKNVYRMYKSAAEKGINFKISSIPDKMENIIITPTKFKPSEMKKLFQVGYMQGLNGIQWKERVSIDEYDNNK